MNLKQHLKTSSLKFGIAGTLLSSALLAACTGYDCGQYAGAVGWDVGAVAIEQPYFGQNCLAQGQDFYCGQDWRGWQSNQCGYAPVGGPAPEVEVGEGPACQVTGLTEDESSFVRAGQRYYLANAQVIAAGLKWKYGIPNGAAKKLGIAFAEARKNNPGPLYAIGFTQADLYTISKHGSLSSARASYIGARLGMSPRSVQRLVRGLSDGFHRAKRG